MGRVFVIGNSKFPRGSSLANYLQYLTAAIKDSGYEVFLISDVNPEFIADTHNETQYGGVVIIPFSISRNRIIKHYQYKCGFAKERIGALRRYHIQNRDIVILLTHDASFCERILKLNKKVGFQLIGGVLELFDRSNYSGSDDSYRKYKYALDELMPKFDMIFPISTFIEDYYKKKGCRTFCLPIMADCHEYPLQPKDNDKYRFVLPANGKMKDDLSSMLRGFALLSPQQLAKIEINICGVKESDARSSLSDSEYRRLEPVLTLHKWMKYDELVALYQRMHYLILARETNQMTQANFPSKVPETMGFGIVPVCSDVGDYTKRYLRDGVDSIFIKGSSPDVCNEAISKAIAMTWESYQEMSNNARKTVETRFDYRVWAPRIKEVLESL